MVFANSVFMLRPENFGFNEETSKSNEFQSKQDCDLSLVRKEFDGVVGRLSDCGVGVDVLPDDTSLKNPDAVFLNNWFSSHPDGSLVLYPMHNPSRQAEVRQELVSYFKNTYELSNILDLRQVSGGSALEGTGSLVFDHAHNSVFLTPSVRSDLVLAKQVSGQLGYHLVSVCATSSSGTPYYHTNIVVAVGKGFLLSSAECIEKPEVLEQYCSNMGLEWIQLSTDQIENGFAGNALQLTSKNGDPCFVLSQRALKSLDAKQIRRIEKHTAIVSSDVTHIEDIGGGSIRCMLAECFWKKQ